MAGFKKAARKADEGRTWRWRSQPPGRYLARSEEEADALLLQISALLQHDDDVAGGSGGSGGSARVREFKELWEDPGHVFVANASVANVFCDALLLPGTCCLSKHAPAGQICAEFQKKLHADQPAVLEELRLRRFLRAQPPPPGDALQATGVRPDVLTWHSRMVGMFAGWGGVAWEK